ncbi:hypothetical protein VTN49DRAFT_4786 [Thermomyces lanuginosus]|uniref:uncharacterized protein n=1 Tax=Thermomyces lanuginosus TaxID=5541 RepID=UPI00374420DA
MDVTDANRITYIRLPLNLGLSRLSFELQWFGDREVCGVAGEGGVQLWFFDPDFVPDIPGVEPLLALEEWMTRKNPGSFGQAP